MSVQSTARSRLSEGVPVAGLSSWVDDFEAVVWLREAKLLSCAFLGVGQKDLASRGFDSRRVPPEHSTSARLPLIGLSTSLGHFPFPFRFHFHSSSNFSLHRVTHHRTRHFHRTFPLEKIAKDAMRPFCRQVQNY